MQSICNLFVNLNRKEAKKLTYIVNKNAQLGTGCHKIHTNECKRKPKKENAVYLGKHMCPFAAKSKAKDYFSNVDGCSYCCKEIHAGKILICV